MRNPTFSIAESIAVPFRHSESAASSSAVSEASSWITASLSHSLRSGTAMFSWKFQLSADLRSELVRAPIASSSCPQQC